MLLTLRTMHVPATDLGFLLHKHPDRVQTFELAFGKAHVFFPEATETEGTAALLLDVAAAEVDDRAYASTSFLAEAIASVLGAALAGECPERPDLAEAAIPLEARVAALRCRGGEGLLRRTFEPLGYAVATENPPLDPAFPAWGPSPYFNLTLKGTCRVRDLLSHLAEQIPKIADGEGGSPGVPSRR